MGGIENMTAMATREQAEKQVSDNYKWFIANLEALMPQYGGMWVVIKDQQIVEMECDMNVAYYAAVKKYGLGNFSIQHCVNPQPIYRVNYGVRVA